MSNRSPVSFTLMCIVLGLILVGIVPGFFMLAADTPSWYGAFMIISILLIVLLVPVAAIFGLIYKTDDPKRNVRNKIGLWSSLTIVALILVVIIYSLYFDDSTGYAMPG